MVSEWEKEELGRLTLRNLKAVQPQPDKGRMTHQNLTSLKATQSKAEHHEAQIKLFFERLKTSLSTGIAAMFVGKSDKKQPNMCETYGHYLPPNSSWSGMYPTCSDCGVQITDHKQLRGAQTKEEKARFRSV
ncbi:MAG: hypothetical protein K2W82_06705 [Candidatus Obscuribacterales bacterium]|jgi:hypothetical protein|nr:hypothetical protein [Candidatus Obscuribacterales bacterium]